MKYTTNYQFRKPEYTDPVDIEDLNYNADEIDAKLKELEDWQDTHQQAQNPHQITPEMIGAETPTGAQQKANQAETNAKSYADQVASDLSNQAETNAKSYADIVANSALNSAKDYADDVLESANSHTDQVASDLSQKLNETRIKVLDVERDVSNISKVLTNLNPGQEAKQSVSGYGILSLPKNAANGQVSVTVKGNTETDEEGNTKSTLSAMRLKSVGKNLFNINGEQIISGINPNQLNYPPKIENGLLYSGGVAGSIAGGYLCFKNDVLNSTVTISLTNSGQSGSCQIQTFDSIDSSNLMVNSVNKGIFAVPIGAWSYTFTADKPYFGFAFFSATRYGMVMRDVQIERGAKTPYEPYTESTQYIIAKDSEGKIAELRSLPNGTKDEIRVVDKRLICRIGAKTNVASGTVIDYSDMTTGGQFVAYASDGTSQVGVKGDTLTITATTLIYQLATPIEIPIQTSGTLVSYPSGTVYIEPYVADAGIYADKMTVLHQDLPIKALEKLSKIDFMTGLETELDVSDAVIAEDNLSFTHPDLVDGDIVFFTYEYDRESTVGETEIEYYDSRYVIKDSVTEKFYKWHIAVANGVPSIELTEV